MLAVQPGPLSSEAHKSDCDVAVDVEGVCENAADEALSEEGSGEELVGKDAIVVRADGDGDEISRIADTVCWTVVACRLDELVMTDTADE